MSLMKHAIFPAQHRETENTKPTAAVASEGSQVDGGSWGKGQWVWGGSVATRTNIWASSRENQRGENMSMTNLGNEIPSN